MRSVWFCDLAAQSVDRDIQVGSGDEFGHNELPGSFGLSLGVFLRDAMIAKVRYK
jgi:hypothetical protein